jgi:hypothetical protein
MLMIGAALLCSAPFIRSFGSGGWVMGVFVSMGWPFAIAVVAGRPVWIPGMLAATAIAASFWLHDVVLKSDRLYAARPDHTLLLSCLGIELALGLIATTAAHLILPVSEPSDTRGFDVLPPKG